MPGKSLLSPLKKATLISSNTPMYKKILNPIMGEENTLGMNLPESLMKLIGMVTDPTSGTQPYTDPRTGQQIPMSIAGMPTWKGISDPRRLLGTGGKKPILDEAGRFLAFEPEANTAYNAHVASSVGKFPLIKGNKPKIQSMEQSFVNKGNRANLAPDENTIERMMAKYRK